MRELRQMLAVEIACPCGSTDVAKVVGTLRRLRDGAMVFLQASSPAACAACGRKFRLDDPLVRVPVWIKTAELDARVIVLSTGGPS